MSYTSKYSFSMLALSVIVSINGCKQPYPERVTYDKKYNATIVEYDTSVAKDLPVYENELGLSNRNYIILKVLENSWPKKDGKVLEKQDAIDSLRYYAWKLKADALLYDGIVKQSETPDQHSYIDYIARGRAIKFSK